MGLKRTRKLLAVMLKWLIIANSLLFNVFECPSDFFQVQPAIKKKKGGKRRRKEEKREEKGERERVQNDRYYVGKYVFD